MSGEKRTEKFQLMMTPSEIEAIDDWGFKQRIRTRAEAIRRLCQIGLAASEGSEELSRLGWDVVQSTAQIMKARAALGPITEEEKHSVRVLVDSALKMVARASAVEGVRQGASRSEVSVERLIELYPDFKRVRDDMLTILEKANILQRKPR